MTRKRTPSPEQQLNDRAIVLALAGGIVVLAKRYPNSVLPMASRLAHEFASAAPEQPAKRKASTKLAPAVAADMAHHSV